MILTRDPSPTAGLPLSPLVRRARAAVQSTFQLPARDVATPATLVAGVRAGTATVLPILVAYATGTPSLVWTALGGWMSTFADSGGAYRVRARHMAAYAVTGSVSILVAALVGHSAALSVVLVCAWAVGGAMLRLFGDGATSVGSLLAVTFVASLAAPAGPGPAADRALLFLLGCAWAMALSLLVWPVRPWQPARRAIAACYDGLARYARGVSEATTTAPAGGEAWHDLALREHAAIRQAIETARSTLGETRRARVGSSRRGEDLVVLLESAELLFETLVAAADQVEAATRAAAESGAANERMRAALRAAADAVAGTLGAVAASIPVIGHWRSEPAPPGHAADRAVLTLWDAAEAEPEPTSARAVASRNAAALLEYAATLADTAAEAARSLLTGVAPPSSPAAPRLLDDEPNAPHPGWWAVLRANLTPQSFALRHALRVGIVAAVATWLGAVLRLPHASWATMTALIVLQPYAGSTSRRGAERLTWTLLGGIVAAVLGAVLHRRSLIGAVMFPLAVASIAVRAAHYGLYTFFLTPVFVLLAEPAPGDWSMALVRALDTVLGGALALVASRVLWPSWEHTRLPTELAAMVDALRRYLRVLEWRALGEPPSTVDRLAAARRGVGLASNNVDAAIQRFVAEPKGPIADVESLMTMLTYVRRMAGSLTALAVGTGGVRPSGAEHVALARALDGVLADLALSLRAERAPAPLPDVVARLVRRRGETSTVRDRRVLRSTLELPAVALGLERVARQAGVLHAAATRVYEMRRDDSHLPAGDGVSAEWAPRELERGPRGSPG